MRNRLTSLSKSERDTAADLGLMATELADLSQSMAATGTFMDYAAFMRRLRDINTAHMKLARRPMLYAQSNPATDWNTAPSERA